MPTPDPPLPPPDTPLPRPRDVVGGDEKPVTMDEYLARVREAGPAV